jgi:WW domain-binding protein 4
MSEYWVSKKKYLCKYCDIYIADDVPSRQQHENGLRHKGNVERYIRGLYRGSEKRKKDLDEEKRDMARIELASVQLSPCYVILTFFTIGCSSGVCPGRSGWT